MDINLLELFPIILFFIGFFGIITSRNIIKSIVFTMIMQTSVIMFWLTIGARYGRTPPIIHDLELLEYVDRIADPLPQALMLTAIIIGMSVTAINITMLNSLFRKHGTCDWTKMGENALEEETDNV